MHRLLIFLATVFGFANSGTAEDPPHNRLVIGANPNHVLIAAHRGGYTTDKHDRAPENSIANLKTAIAKGYDVYETDIQRTADGVFVIIHDATVDRETTGSGPAKGMQLSELKRLKKRYRDGSESNESVATLSEMLMAGKGSILFKPDLKPGIIDHFAELAKMIHSLEMVDQVFLRTGFRDLAEIKRLFDNGCPRVNVMIKTRNRQQVRAVIDKLNPRTIHIDLAKGETPDDEKSAAIMEAVAAGVLVQTHIYGSDRAAWNQLAESGVRMFHTTNPDATMKYLESSKWRSSPSEQPDN